MKIVHLCLSGFFIDESLYQDNELVREHLLMGHCVLVVASTEVFDARGHVTYTEAKDYIGAEGARVIRLPYRRWLPHAVARRVRSYPGVRAILDQFAPDVIMFHGSSAWELLTAARYVRDNPKVVFHIDSHSDAINSGNGWVSKEILHRRFYAPILRHAMSVSGPLLCVSLSVMDFARRIYRIPSEWLEFYPLGGRILETSLRLSKRVTVRQRLGLSDAQILIVQSGKQNRLKKLPQSLRALAQVENPNLRLVIAGVLQDDIKAEVETLIAADPRVTFLGWQGSEELTDLLCAADIYLQPGTQSATMQHSLCCGCAVILDAISGHEPYVDGNGWLVKTEAELTTVLAHLADKDIGALKAASLALSERMLDYARLAARVLN
jgi:hypothetical protein